MNNKLVNCPSCNSSSHAIKIFYGLVNLDIIDKLRQGLLVIGSGSLWPERPSHICSACNIQYNQAKEFGTWENTFKNIHKVLAEAA